MFGSLLITQITKKIQQTMLQQQSAGQLAILDTLTRIEAMLRERTEYVLILFD
jgi:hypothetical protein